jgi:lipoyl(octanoyl) transferase
MNVVDLGRLSYLDGLAIQQSVLERVVNEDEPDTLLLAEHNPVITLGAAHHRENLLATPEQLAAAGIEAHASERGGDVTYHGPGQLVAYPIFNLSKRGKDLHKWLRDLEEVALKTLSHFGLEGYRFSPHTGVWVNDAKVCAIGVKVRKWVSMHGLALNCDNDLTPFNLIVPCGIRDYGVTSLSAQLGRDVPTSEVKPVMVAAFRDVFESRF